jgi:RimJ/RimL family protein N-acetyltransferase
VRLETERLVLRRPRRDDLDAYAGLFSDPEVVRYIGGVTKTRAESAEAIDRMLRHWDEQGVGLFSAVRKEDERVLGHVGFLVWDTATWQNAMHQRPGESVETEIGWALAREHWGHGYATEGATAVRDLALGELGLRRVISLIQRGNEASVRVALKLGETLEREDLGGPFKATVDLYALTVAGPAR